MPVVHRNKINLQTQGGVWIEFERVIKYDSHLKRFSIELPEWWSKTLGFNEVMGETESAVEIAWDQAQKHFKELTTNKRKVIIYSFSSSAILSVKKNGEYMSGVDDEDFDHVIFRSEGSGQEHSMSFTKGTALDVWFEVGYETSSSFEEYKTYVDLKDRKIGESSHEDLKVMDWTPKREEFFRNFDLELAKLIFKLNTFLNGETGVMAALIDRYRSVAALPLPQPKEEDQK